MSRKTLTTLFLLTFFTVCLSSALAADLENGYIPVSTDVTTSIIKDDALSTQVEINVNSVNVRNVESLLRTEEFTSGIFDPITASAGWPELPMITRTLLVPPKSGVKLKVTEIISRTERDFDPFIVPVLEENTITALSGEPSEEYRQWEGFWPAEPVVVSKPAILRGHRLVQVTIYPMQVNPKTNEVRYNDKVNFELTYGGEGENALRNPDRIPPSIYARRALETLVDNPRQLPRRDDVQSGSYLYIYPDDDDWEEILQPLFTWRKRQGHNLVTHRLESNNRNDIMALIEEAYFEWDVPVEFVTLVGDADGKIQSSGQHGGNYGVDTYYALIDGDDKLPDIALGRISVETDNELRRVVNKLVSYEADPYMVDEDGEEDESWLTRGCVVAGYPNNGLGTVLVSKYTRKTLLELGYDEVLHWFHNEDGQITGNQPFLQEAFEEGISFLQYRAYQKMNQLPVNVIADLENTDGRWPPVVAVSCNTGDFVGIDGHTELFLRSEGGAIGAIGTCTPQTRVQYNNIISGGVVKGILKDKLYAFGWGLNMGKYELWRSYEGFGAAYEGFIYWNNLMGDAGTHIHTGKLQKIDVNHSGSISLGESMFSVSVSDAVEDVIVADALVCLYKAGEDGDELQVTAYTDDEGLAILHIPPDAMTAGELMVTVTKHNVKAYLAEIGVAQRDYFIGADGWEINDGGGGFANPSEEFDISFDLRNFGSETPDGPLTVEIVSNSPLAEVMQGDFEIEDVPDAGDAVNIRSGISISSSAPDGEVILLSVNTSNDDWSWSSAIAFEVYSPDIEIVEVNFQNEEFGPGQNSEIDFTLKNVGRESIGEFNAALWCTSDRIGLVRAGAVYSDLDIGNSAGADGESFRITAHPFSIPGMFVELFIAVEDENGFRDTTSTWIKIGGDPEDNDPFGPDEYGYVCFDNSDVDWEMAPVYDWVEISGSAQGNDFDGEDLNLSDTGDNLDESTVVDLPFEFQYYGEVFDELTICTNGWAAFGDQSQLLAFRNRRIGQALGPDAQLAVWWDNLGTVGDSEILTYYDEGEGDDDSRFIIEWYKMRRLIGVSASGPWETFQIILYDTPTYSGDGVIVYQYKSVENGDGVARNDHPYCTIGIGNLDDSDGLEYTYWNSFSPGAKSFPRNQEVEGIAIKFTTDATSGIVGVLAGRMLDARSGNPIPGAEITTTRGFFAITDDDGIYANNEILIGDGYIVTAHRQGYNDSTLAGDDGLGYAFAEGETTWVDFGLLHPEFNLDRDSFLFRVWPDSEFAAILELSNDGNGPLDFRSKYVYVEEDSAGNEAPRRDDPLETRLIWDAGDTLDNTKLHAVEFAGGRWIVAADDPDRIEHKFYTFDRLGNLEDTLAQPVDGSNRAGIYDMAYYDDLLYCVAYDDYLHLIDPETGEEQSSFLISEDLSRSKSLTVTHDGRILISSATKPIYVFSMNDSSLVLEETIERPLDPRPGFGESQIRNFGMAWFRDEGEGYNLFINHEDQTYPERALFKYNLESGDIRFVTNFVDIDSSYALFRGRSGLCITPRWDNYILVMAMVLDDPGHDGIGVFEIAPNTYWLDYQPRKGHLDASERVDIEFSLTTNDLEFGAYGVNIRFAHNADSGWAMVPVDLDVVPYSVSEETFIPLDWSLDQNWPNPFNPMTQITFTLKEESLMKLTVFDITGRQIAVLADEHRPAGSHRIMFDALTLPAGLYFYRLEAGDFVAVRKMVLVK